MTSNQLKLCEETIHEIIKANHTVYARETPLSVAKEIQGLRAVFDEVRTHSLVPRPFTLCHALRYTRTPLESSVWGFRWIPSSVIPRGPGLLKIRLNFVAERKPTR